MNEDDLSARLAALEQRIAGMEQLLDGRLDALGKRLDKIGAFLAGRVTRISNAQSIYLGDYTALTFLESGEGIYVDTRSRDIGSHLLSQGRWDGTALEVFRRLVKPGDCVLDLGANHGFYAIHAAKLTGPQGRVEAFEPNPRLADLARGSLGLNGCDWVHLHQLAVGDRAGRAMLTLNHSASGGGFVREPPMPTRDQQVPVSVVVLDEMFSDPAFTVDVVKMDIEGYEGRALRGMRKLLERSPQVRILLEFVPEMLAQAGTGARDLAEQCRALEFSAWSVGPKGVLSPVSWDELAETKGGTMNIVVAREEPGG